MKIKILMATAAVLALSGCGKDEPAVTADNMAVDNMAMDSSSGAPTDNMAADPAAPANGQDYAAKASAGDMFEIESSKLAISKSKNAGLKELAQMIVADHEKASADLKTAAGKAGPAITVAPALDAEQQTNIEALKSADAAQFDQLYLQQQIAAHEKALAMVRAYAATGEVPSLKEHAGAVAGPIEKHLERAKTLQATP